MKNFIVFLSNIQSYPIGGGTVLLTEGSVPCTGYGEMISSRGGLLPHLQNTPLFLKSEEGFGEEKKNFFYVEKISSLQKCCIDDGNTGKYLTIGDVCAILYLTTT